MGRMSPEALRKPLEARPFQPPEVERRVDATCKACGGPITQRSRWRLLLVGSLMIAAAGLAAFLPYLWAPAIILGLAGAYLLAWAILGKGRWCRTCKRFNVT